MPSYIPQEALLFQLLCLKLSCSQISQGWNLSHAWVLIAEAWESKFQSFIKRRQPDKIGISSHQSIVQKYDKFPPLALSSCCFKSCLFQRANDRDIEFSIYWFTVQAKTRSLEIHIHMDSGSPRSQVICCCPRHAGREPVQNKLKYLSKACDTGCCCHNVAA